MSNHDLRNKAIEIAMRACDEDRKTNYEEAYNLYKQSIRFFMYLYKYEQNHILKESFREKLGEYMKRAEELAEYLHGEEISGNQPEEDD